MYDPEIRHSIRYLGSGRALRSLAADVYWPKWDSPWWHMLLLHEMGETGRIPEAAIEAYVEALRRLPLKIFPIHPEDMPEGVDPYRGTACHCQVGSAYQMLAAWGLDVDRELPWMRPWFLRYQMADGGLNCDNDAYLVEDEVPSSMVGTIAVFEAVLLHTPRPWTVEERTFLDKGARFLMDRALTRGSPTRHNAAERESAEDWLKPCFPRFYFYDALRGLDALLTWSEKTGQAVSADAIRDTAVYLDGRFPDGLIRNERRAYEGRGTFLQSATGEWVRQPSASLFPLLTKVSVVGDVSPCLSKQWAESKARIFDRAELKDLIL